MGRQKRIVIVGAGGFGREVLELLRKINEVESQWQFIGFVARDIPDQLLLDRIGGAWVGTDDVFLEHPTATHFVVAIAEPEVRQAIAGDYEAAGLIPATLIHPRAEIGPDVSVGDGSILCALASATTNVAIGRHVIVDRHASIGHDVVIHDYATLHPACVVSGGVTIESGARVGTGSCLLPLVRVGEGSLVGAGAVVTSDVSTDVIVVGVPARRHTRD